MVSHSSDQFDPAPQPFIPRLPVRTGLAFMLGCLFFLALLILPAYTAQGNSLIIYVDQTATGDNDGSTWQDAFTDLQSALDAASAGDEIWVAAGLYKPGKRIDPDDPRSVTFLLKHDVALYGGFDGSESARDARDWEANVTVLSGDIDDNDSADANGVVTNTGNITGDNSYHVLMGRGSDSTTILDGFTITAGKATGDDFRDRRGGGMLNIDNSPVLTNVTFSGNHASSYGGGMYSVENSGSIASHGSVDRHAAANRAGQMANEAGNPTLTNVTFYNNTASHGAGMFNRSNRPILTSVTFSGNRASFSGGGMYNDGPDEFILTNVTFSGNEASGRSGGGMYNRYSNPTLTDVLFSGNFTGEKGGGMYNHHSNPALTNVTFNGNSAGAGGGMFNYDSSPALTNVTISGNDASGEGGGIVNSQSRLTIANSILWGNRDGSGIGQSAQISTTASTITVSYSLVQDGVYTGTGNISGDPRFVRNPDDGGDGWGTGNNDDYGDLRLQNDSPAVDTGSNDLLPPDSTDLDGDGDTGEPVPYDLDGQPRVVDHPFVESDGTVVDMGAYERQFIEVHVTSTVDPAEPLPGEDVTYLLQFGNTGSLPAEAVTLTGSLPANLIDVTITHSGTEPARTGDDPYAWSMDELAAGTGGTIRFRGTLEEGVPAGTSLSAVATISTTSAELNEDNNRDVAVLTVGNAPPRGQDNRATTSQETAVTLPVLANDHDANHDPLTIIDAGTPGNGTSEIIQDGTLLRYTPNAGFHGTDQFTYTVSDGALTATTTVTIAVVERSDDTGNSDRTLFLPFLSR